MTLPPTTPGPTASPPAVRWRLWRSVVFGWAVVGLALVGGVPLFLCMPPWTDVTLYDVAARNVLRGGVHYRDVFDTNLPGVVWAMAAIRATCGWGYEVLRAWDLVLVGSASVVLGILVRRAGATTATVAWYAAAVALFYPFTSEFNHCQRDPWMLLPGAVACWMRVGSLRRSEAGEPVVVWRAVVEGIVWGLAVWLKPHVLVPAAAVWVVSVVLLSRNRPVRTAAAEAAGIFAGGLLAGITGIAWLVGTGAWLYFWDVFSRWNPEYVTVGVFNEIPEKAEWAFWYFRPWSLIHLAALPLAVVSLRAAFTRSPGPTTPAARAVLAALYLAWFAQALVLQRGYDYVHIPETILAIAFMAARGWAVGFLYLTWFVIAGAILGLAAVTPGAARLVDSVNGTNHYLRLEYHRLTDPRIIGLWPRCWQEGSSPRLRDKLAHDADIHCTAKWEDLEAVRHYLGRLDPPLRDRELTCWNDSTHPLYLDLGLAPSTRYMHFGTVFTFRGKLTEVRREIAQSPQKYVVSDLGRMTWSPARAYDPGAAGPLSLPAWLPRSQRHLFPWNQPIVFRAGRYLVHRVTTPPNPDEIDIPHWNHLDELGPGE